MSSPGERIIQNVKTAFDRANKLLLLEEVPVKTVCRRASAKVINVKYDCIRSNDGGSAKVIPYYGDIQKCFVEGFARRLLSVN